MDLPPFDLLGCLPPASPVIVSVPHAGREYPLALRAALRLPLSAAIALEDRHVDTVARAARGGQTMLVQAAARAWIDLNRREDERDPLIDEGACAAGAGGGGVAPSAKLRGGLGLVPRRGGPAGDLWVRRFADADIAQRIAGTYRPYHAALSDALAAARARFGVAVLLDVHSMPPLGAGGHGARVVLGDRFGRAADARFVARIEAVANAARVRVALNAPYAGGHILERHAAPARGIHGIQIEIDRSLYLDRRLDRPGAGFADTVALLQSVIAALEDEALAGGALALAAE